MATEAQEKAQATQKNNQVSKDRLKAELAAIEAEEQKTAQAAQQKWDDALARLEQVAGHHLELNSTDIKLIAYLDILIHDGGLDKE